MMQTEYVPRQTISYRDVPRIEYRQEAYTTSEPVTTYQPVTRYRTVPYPSVARIPEVSTEYVPQQRLGYFTSAPQFACDPCIPSVPLYPTLPAMPASQSAAVPESPMATPQAHSQWQTVPQRQAQEDAGITTMSGITNPLRQGLRRSAFQPAPSAATAWQSRWLR